MILRRLPLAVLAMSLCGLLFGQDVHLLKGLELFRQEQYPDALREFEVARAAHPANPAIENVLGITETKLGHLERANQHYQAALRLDPRLEDAHKNLAFNDLNLAQYQAAEKELKIALHLRPDDPLPHFYLAMLYLATGNVKQLAEEVKPSLLVLANDPEVGFRMAKTCLETGRADLALLIVNTRDGQPSPFTVLQQRELAILFFHKGMYPEAASQFRRIVAAEPSWEDEYNLAISLLNAKKTDEASALLERLASERSNDADVLGVLGSAYESENKIAQALHAYKRETAVDPEHADRYLDYSRLLMDLARYDDSTEFVKEGLRRVHDPYALYMRLGSIQMMASKYDEAREYFQKALDERPEIPVSYVAIAQLYFKNGQNEEAAKVLATARQKLHKDVLIEYYYGLAVDRLGQQSEAVSALERAVSLNPDLADIHYELGRLYFEMNQIPPARKELERAIELKADYARAYILLSRVYMRLGEVEKAHKLAQEARRMKQEEQEYGVRSQQDRLKNLQPLETP